MHSRRTNKTKQKKESFNCFSDSETNHYLSRRFHLIVCNFSSIRNRKRREPGRSVRQRVRSAKAESSSNRIVFILHFPPEWATSGPKFSSVDFGFLWQRSACFVPPSNSHHFPIQRVLSDIRCTRTNEAYMCVCVYVYASPKFPFRWCLL